MDLSETGVSLVGLEKGVESLPNLEKLNLDESLGLSNKGLIEVLRISGTYMKELNLYSTFITGIGLEANVRSLPSLQMLDLNSSKITDKGFHEILKICGTKLIDLTLSSTNITGVGLEERVKCLPSLQILHLDDSDITDNGLLEILTVKRKRMKTIHVTRDQISTTLQNIRKSHQSVCINFVD